MIKAFQKVIAWITSLWRTLVCTFCKEKRHIRIEDVDHDGVDEIIIDPNGNTKDSE